MMTTVEELSHSPAAPGRLGGWISRNGPVLGVFAAVFALWEIAVRALSIPDYILPAPLGDHREDRRLLAAAAVERHRHLAGDPARIRAQRACRHPARRRGGLFRNFERVAFPFMVSLQTIPKVALAPILVMWLGYGILPKVMVAFLISFFPIVINSVIGMRSVEKEMIYLV